MWADIVEGLLTPGKHILSEPLPGVSVSLFLFQEFVMNELISIENRGGIETVNAREVWAGLESKQDFSTWVKSRLEGFVEDQDYLLHKFMEQQPSGAKQKIDYYLTIDTAKHVAMLERNDKGRAIRQYFIDYEKNNKPARLTGAALMAAALIEASAIIEQQKNQIEAMKPAAQFYADVTGSRDAISIGDAAKIIGMGYGQKQLFELLRSEVVLMANNVPYQTFIDRQWFRVIEQKYTTPKGETKISIKTLVYQKGIDGIIKIIRKTQGIY